MKKRVFFDTSILVSALTDVHPFHRRAFPFLGKVRDKHIHGAISAHTLAELYSVLTTLPIKPYLAPSTVFQMIQEDILPYFEIVTLSESDYRDVLSQSARVNRRGGSVYDVLILEAAKKFKANEIMTFNRKHFIGYDLDLDSKISEPEL